MFKKLFGAKFFQTLPPKIKVIVHAIELMVGLYFTTAVTLKAMFNDPRLVECCVQIAIAYLAIYPFAHIIVEMMSGVGVTDAGEKPPARSKYGEIMPTTLKKPNDGRES